MQHSSAALPVVPESTLETVARLTASRDWWQDRRAALRAELAPAGTLTGAELDSAFLLVADAPAPARVAERPVQLAMLPAADSTVAATGLLF